MESHIRQIRIAAPFSPVWLVAEAFVNCVGYPTVKKIDMFIRFDTIHERDGHTDGRTPHDDIGRACIASRGKNYRVPWPPVA